MTMKGHQLLAEARKLVEIELRAAQRRATILAMPKTVRAIEAAIKAAEAEAAGKRSQLEVIR